MKRERETEGESRATEQNGPQETRRGQQLRARDVVKLNEKAG